MADQETTLNVGIPKETFPGETRVAVAPNALAPLMKSGCRVLLEAGAGVPAGFPDSEYADKGVEIVTDRKQLFDRADLILQVRGYGMNPEAGEADLSLFRKGQTTISMLNPLGKPKLAERLAQTGVTAFSMELMPRITRAQSMDALSSMATIAGYKAVLLAANALPRMFPMFMTAAGTVAAAHVLVVGAGVAGLQAIATAKRLGAVVQAYDIRPAVKEQVQSLGAKFVRLELETESAEDKGGYAKAMDEDFYKRQRALMAKVVANNDVVVTTAAVPGKKAPVLITQDMVEGMASGSVIVDLAAEQGGNCELSKLGETVVHRGVTIIGPANVASSIPYHASQMYGKNIQTFVSHLVKKGVLEINMDDEITRETLVSRDGAVVHPRVKEALG
ncbi:MAG: Re/Si-specific NAD(P)(+) transhydrogenase subunit alpha [Candidatus Zixiibacteriota bacterium]